MNAPLVLRHQNVVLFPLLLSLHLSAQAVKVLVLLLLSLHVQLPFFVICHRVVLVDLVGVESICLARKHLLLLVCSDLVA